MFEGVYTAIITPFRNGKVDEKKLEEMVAFQVEAGVNGVVPCGSTGEFLYLSKEEQKRIIEICVRICKGKTKVIAGTATLSIEDTIELANQAQKVGADAALIITPWYIKPSQENLYLYYKKVSEKAGIPFIIYNNPARTGIDTSLETLVKLAPYEAVQGFKDAAPNIIKTSEIRCALGDRFSLLTGNDEPLAAYLAMGGDGGILAASNVVPHLFISLLKAWDEGDLGAFKKLWKRAFPLLAALSLETNPAPLKYAMTLTHGVSPEMRLPFGPLRPETQDAVENALVTLGLWEPLALVRKK